METYKIVATNARYEWEKNRVYATGLTKKQVVEFFKGTSDSFKKEVSTVKE